jgi:hypothetical protein
MLRLDDFYIRYQNGSYTHFGNSDLLLLKLDQFRCSIELLLITRPSNHGVNYVAGNVDIDSPKNGPFIIHIGSEAFQGAALTAADKVNKLKIPPG